MKEAFTLMLRTLHLLSPAELGEIGFAMVSYPVTMIFRIVKTMQQALKDLQEGKLNLEGEGIGFDEFKEIIGFKEWSLLDEKYTTKE